MSSIFLKKDDQEIPDNFGIQVSYLTGKSEEFEAADFRIVDTNLCAVFSPLEGGRGEARQYENRPIAGPYFEIATSEDIWHIIPVSAVLRLSFDKRYSKIVALKKAQKKG